jgi:hypothetical protein
MGYADIQVAFFPLKPSRVYEILSDCRLRCFAIFFANTRIGCARGNVYSKIAVPILYYLQRAYMGLVYRFWKRRCMLKWGLDTTVVNAPLDLRRKRTPWFWPTMQLLLPCDRRVVLHSKA